jgi:hypothetical protein
MDYKHPVVLEYISACDEISSYYLSEICETVEASKRFKLALKNIRKYLDSLNLKMPSAKFPYEAHDKRTWKILDVVIKGSRKKGRRFGGDIINPDWKYA